MCDSFEIIQNEKYDKCVNLQCEKARGIEMQRKLATEIMKYDDYLAYFERSKSSYFIILYQTYACVTTIVRSKSRRTKQPLQKMRKKRRREWKRWIRDVVYSFDFVYNQNTKSYAVCEWVSLCVLINVLSNASMKQTCLTIRKKMCTRVPVEKLLCYHRIKSLCGTKRIKSPASITCVGNTFAAFCCSVYFANFHCICKWTKIQ